MYICKGKVNHIQRLSLSPVRTVKKGRGGSLVHFREEGMCLFILGLVVSIVALAMVDLV
jgi:hypothetical protein